MKSASFEPARSKIGQKATCIFQKIKSCHIVISVTYEFAVLFWVARHDAVIFAAHDKIKNPWRGFARRNVEHHDASVRPSSQP